MGWAFYGHWHVEESRRILRLHESGAPQGELDEAIADVWNGEMAALLRNVAIPLGRFGQGVDLELQRRCQQRQTLINEAVECHHEGRYAAAITLTLTQIDGLTREIVGSTFFNSKPGQDAPDFTDDTTLAGIEGNLPEVRKAFSAPVNTVGRYGGVSRHGVIHGMDLSFATRVNSTKTLVLVGALAEHLEARAAARAAKGRRSRDRAKSALHGTDATGRLLDDRDMEELYMFRAEFETDVFWAILSSAGTDEAALVRQAHIRLSERRLSRQRFAFGQARRREVWWSYRTPGGQHLGSAMRIQDIITRPVTQERWTWDSADAPRSGPWDEPNGWTEAPGDPSTPNWLFGGFYAG